MRSERRRHENILRKVLIQRNCEFRQCTAQEMCSPIARAVICSGCWRACPFPTANTWSSTRLFRWVCSRQHDRTPTKIASALENFPATVIMPSAWPDWSKFQFLSSWHGEILNHTNNNLPGLPRFEPHEQQPSRHERSALTTRPNVRCNLPLTCYCVSAPS